MEDSKFSKEEQEEIKEALLKQLEIYREKYKDETFMQMNDRLLNSPELNLKRREHKIMQLLSQLYELGVECYHADGTPMITSCRKGNISGR